MEKVYLFLFSIFLLGLVFASSTANMHVNAQIFSSSLGISVPEEVNFTNITCGYWQKEKIDLVNTGTVDINVTPSLDSSYSGTLFENLGFSTNSPGTGSTPSSGEKIGNYTVRISRPEIYGGENSESIYIYLDLTNYSNCNSNTINESTDVIFTAVEA